jgi:hypothetical protein
LLIAVGWADSRRSFSFSSIKILGTIFLINTIFEFLVHRGEVILNLKTIYSGIVIFTILSALLTGYSIWQSRQNGASTKWKIFTLIGMLSLVISLIQVLGYKDFSYKLISESQTIWPGVLMGLSALSLLMFVYSVAASRRDAAFKVNKVFLIATALGIPALSQLFPVFESRHIYWSCVPLATVAIAWVSSAVFIEKVRKINLLILSTVLTFPFSATAIGYYERQIEPRVKLEGAGFFDGLMLDPKLANWLLPLLASVRGYEQTKPQTPIIFIGHNFAFGLTVQNKLAANRYSLRQYNYIDPKDYKTFSMFVRKYKPIFWLEGSFIALSQNRDFVPKGYCLIGSAPSSEVNSFATQILAPCANQANQADQAEYTFIPSRPSQTKLLDSFPSELSMIEVQVPLGKFSNLDSINVLALGGLGNWTTLPIKNTWGIAIVEKSGDEYRIRNEGLRVEKMNLAHADKVIFWFSDNGRLSKCPELQVDLGFNGGEHKAIPANCE